MQDPWLVIYTKPRNEKKVAERLAEKGFEVYCPLVTTIRQWSDRRKKVKVPLINSYLFIRVAEHRRDEVLQDPGVVRFIFWLGRPAVVREEEIEALKDILDIGSDIQVSNQEFERGQLVKIGEGAFKGLDGEIVDVDRNIIVLYIQQLGCKIQFKYSKRFLERGAGSKGQGKSRGQRAESRG